MSEVDWERTVFTLLAPDALLRHLGDAVLDRLGGGGFRPVGWRVVWHRPPALDAFNERNITEVWHGYLYRLIDQLFAVGPTVALLMYDERPDPELTSHQRLRRLKGASEPARAGSDTIRGGLRSVNVLLALMHSADSAADSRHESEVFTGETGYLSGDPADLYRLVGLLQAARPAETRDHARVLAGLRARVLAVAWDELEADARQVAAGLDLSRLGQPGAGKPLADLMPAGHPLAGILRADFTPEQPGPLLDRVRPLLRAYGTDLDPWEDLVLASSRRFAPPPQ